MSSRLTDWYCKTMSSLSYHNPSSTRTCWATDWATWKLQKFGALNEVLNWIACLHKKWNCCKASSFLQVLTQRTSLHRFSEMENYVEDIFQLQLQNTTLVWSTEISILGTCYLRDLIPYHCEGNIESSKSQWNASSNNFAFGTCDQKRSGLATAICQRRRCGAYTHDPARYQCALRLFARRLSNFWGFPLEMPNSYNWGAKTTWSWVVTHVASWPICRGIFPKVARAKIWRFYDSNI